MTTPRFLFHKQIPKPPAKGTPVALSIGEDGTAHLFDRNDRLIGEIVRTRISFAGRDSIMLNGFECTGHDRTGRKKYRYQEWLLRYLEET